MTEVVRHESGVVSRPVTIGRAIRSEWIKFRSLRSTWAMLGGAVAGMIVIGLIVAYNTRHLSRGLQLDDVVASSTLQGYYLGQLLIGSLGVLFVSGEYSTGSIRSTLAAVPKRLPVLWAKLVVFVTVITAVMVPASLVAFVSAQALISRSRVGFSLTDPGVARVVVGTGVYLTLLGMLGAAIGWCVRSTPGAIVLYVAVILVIPGIFEGLLGTWGRHVAQYLPSRAGASFSTSLAPSLPNLTPRIGLLVMCIWVCTGITLAAILLRRRDA